MRFPGDRRHATRESVWVAYGDLAAGRAERAVTMLERVCELQYRSPGEPWHGTFPVLAEAPRPRSGARVWDDYDPNWRQFVGCTLAMVVDDHEHRLPPPLVGRLERAIGTCVAGEPSGRIPPHYTNPALLAAWLAAWDADRRGRRVSSAHAERLAARAVGRGAVDEYNCPTYYGVDLYALGLWQRRPPLPAFAEAGASVEELLRRDLRELYHPGLANLCGPYSRAHGMDLAGYVGLAGLWLWLATDGAERPLPARLDESTAHVHDLLALPLLEATLTAPFGVDAVLPRRVERRIGRRRITAHLGEGWMAGGEAGVRAHGVWRQYVPGAAHWRGGSFRAVASEARPVDASVDADGTLVVRVVGAADDGDRQVLRVSPGPG